MKAQKRADEAEQKLRRETQRAAEAKEDAQRAEKRVEEAERRAKKSGEEPAAGTVASRRKSFGTGISYAAREAAAGGGRRPDCPNTRAFPSAV